MGKLLSWPVKLRRKRRTREEITAELAGMTVAEWRRWQMTRDAHLANGTWDHEMRAKVTIAIRGC